MDDGFYSAYPALASELGWMMQSNQISDEVLLQALAQEYWSDLTRFAGFFLAREDLADQAASDTILAAIHSRHRYWGEASLKTWLLALAHKTCQKVEAQNSQAFLKDIRLDQQSGHAELAAPTSPGASHPLLPALNQLQELPLIAVFLRYAMRLNAREAASVVRLRPRRIGHLLHEARLLLYPLLDWNEVSTQPPLAGPTCSWARDRFEPAQEGLLKPKEAQAFQEHLTACLECQEAFKAAENIERQLAEALEEIWPRRQPAEEEISAVITDVHSRLTPTVRRFHYSLHLKELIFVGVIIALMVAVGLAAQVLAPDENADDHNRTSEGANLPSPADFLARLKSIVTGDKPASLLDPGASPGPRPQNPLEMIE